MKKELDEALCRDFPRTFADRHVGMCWGFTCGDGWEPLIRRCASKIEAEINKLDTNDIRAKQVKEKFGTIHFRMTRETDTIANVIHEAEAESLITCEICGAPGKLNANPHWHRTICEACPA